MSKKKKKLIKGTEKDENDEKIKLFNEVSRQKKQIETILKHMTDGIIAFDMNGNYLWKALDMKGTDNVPWI